jgi:hypothetical protein
MENYNDFASATNEEISKMNGEYKTKILQSDENLSNNNVIPRTIVEPKEKIIPIIDITVVKFATIQMKI